MNTEGEEVPEKTENILTFCKECPPEKQKLSVKICTECEKIPLCLSCAQKTHPGYILISNNDFVDTTTNRFKEIFEKCKCMNVHLTNFKEGKNQEKEYLNKFWKEETQFLTHLTKKFEEIKDNFYINLKEQYGDMENRVVKTYAKLTEISGKTIALRDVVKVKKSQDKDHNKSLELKLALSLS